MERESLLTVLMILLGGAALQVIGAWLSTRTRLTPGFERERAAWLRLWWPLTPALIVAAWLCGWALSQPDPVPDRVGPLVFIVCAPFVLIVMRAILRAGWSLLGGPEQFGIATIGLIRPHIVFAPELARLLDDRAIQAALAHERAHVRHRDPLRIWIAQFVTDLQWPWTSAQKRFERWLAALERARDDEARAEGIEGADLAAALVASVRFHRDKTITAGTITAGAAGACARLTGDRSALEDRVARLLQPLAGEPKDRMPTTLQVAFLLSLALLVAVALGVVYGERFVGTLLALS
jgi:BlaR1 peptidase M56